MGLFTRNEINIDPVVFEILNTISKRLANIEKQLGNVIRIEERTNNHEGVLKRYGGRLDGHSGRLQSIELWQAGHGDKTSSEKLLNNINANIKMLGSKIDVLESEVDKYKGVNSVNAKLLKWGVGIASAIIIFWITKRTLSG